VDIPNLPTEVLKRKMRDAVLSRAARVPGIIFGYIEDKIAAELRELRSDIDGALEYIAALPENARKAAYYSFFSGFFSHYLPRKLLRHYVYGGGAKYVLTEQEMIDCNPTIRVQTCPAFVNVITNIDASKGPVTKPMVFDCFAAAGTNGTLGGFTVKINGTLSFQGNDDWLLKGKMSFYDIYDFDPKEFGGKSRRSVPGEIKTRFAHYSGLPGNGFTVESEQVEFQQSNSDRTIVWKGGTPTIILDRAS